MINMAKASKPMATIDIHIFCIDKDIETSLRVIFRQVSVQSIVENIIAQSSATSQRRTTVKLQMKIFL